MNDEALQEAIKLAIDMAWDHGYQTAIDALSTLADGVNNPATKGNLAAAAEILLTMKPNHDRNQTVKDILAGLNK